MHDIKGILDLSDIDNISNDTMLESVNPESVGGGDHHENPVNIPDGGLNSHPSVPGDTGPSIPSSTEITDAQYKAALAALQKSYQEGAEILSILSNSKVVEVDPAEVAMESAIDDAILNALESGPVFEAVDRSDKNEVKKIVAKIRKDIKQVCKDNSISYYEPNKIARILVAAVGGAANQGVSIGTSIATGNYVGAAATAASGGALQAIQVFWRERIWQIVGVCHAEGGNIKDITESLTEKFKDDLGEYKILAIKTAPIITDLFRTKFNWKNAKNSYFLVVDRKLTKELREMHESAEQEVEDREEFTEATRLSKEINQAHEEVKSLYDKYRQLRELRNGYGYGSAQYKYITSKMDALEANIQNIGKKFKQLGVKNHFPDQVLTILNDVDSKGNAKKPSSYDASGENAKRRQRDKFGTEPAEPKKGSADLQKQVAKILNESYSEESESEESTGSIYHEYVRAFIANDEPGTPLSREEFTEAYIAAIDASAQEPSDFLDDFLSQKIDG